MKSFFFATKGQPICDENESSKNNYWSINLRLYQFKFGISSVRNKQPGNKIASI